jgi:hypothetical protein
MLISRPITFSVFDATQTQLLKLQNPGTEESLVWKKEKDLRRGHSTNYLDGVGLTSAALVLGELDAKTLLGVGKSFHRGLGHCEFPAARGASSDDWNHAQPFQHPEIAF